MPAASLGWPAPPTAMVGVCIASALYWRGLRYCRSRGPTHDVTPWRIAAFGGGLALILVALSSPVDGWSDRLFWAHMVQHQLLIMGAAPLLLLGQPAFVLWRGVPIEGRRAVLTWALRHRWSRQLWRPARWLGAPLPVWLIFTATLWAWHDPPLYELALRWQGVHDLEHLMFLGTALLFWAQVIPSRLLRPRLSYIPRVLFLATSALQGNLLGAVFMLAQSPIYGFYATQPRPAGTISAVADQHLAGFAMDAPGLMIYGGAMVILLARWLQADEQTTRQRLEPARYRGARP